MEDKQLDDWLEGEYLRAMDVQQNDIIEIVEKTGLVENTFGKKKFDFKVLWDGKEKILSANSKQYLQISKFPNEKKFSIEKKPFGNTFTMDFKPITPEKV